MIKSSTYNITRKLARTIVAHNRAVNSILEFNSTEIEQLCNVTIERLRTGGKILFLGNGGSAADCQHLAAEFIGKFKTDRIPLPAVALTTDSSVLTAVANDYGYENVFVRQIRALCKPGDIVIAISTSGNSRNILLGMEEARTMKAFTVGLLGKDGGELQLVADLPIVVRSFETARIQETHILIGHILCDICDEYFTGYN